MYVDLRSAVGRAIYMKGEFDPRVFDPIAHALKAGGLFLDVGANVGYYSMRALDCVGETGAVHGFEIDPRSLRCLRRTIARESANNFFVHEFAVSDTSGTGYLTMRPDAGHSSVAVTGGGRAVPLGTLDDWRKRNPSGKIHAIKMDIEGSELAALRGARELLGSEKPLLVCEVREEFEGRKISEAARIFELLASVGYRWRWLDGTNDPAIVAEA